MLVSVIIVNYRDYNTTRECLESIEKTTYPNYEVIVVDNESDTDKLAELQDRFKKFKFIGSSRNLYYADGNNLGIEHSAGELVVLLNNDTKVTPTWLDPLVDMAKREPMAFYQPKILFMDNPGLINSMGNTMNIFGFAFPISIGKNENQLDAVSVNEVFYCSGACVLTSRDVIRKIGMLDSNYYTYYEDVNWGWRGRLVGIKSFVVPQSIIYHKWGGSYSNKLSGKKLFFLERARISSLLRNLSMRTIMVLLPSLLAIDLALLAYCIRKRLISYKIRAIIDVWKNFGNIMSERRSIQSTRLVRDLDLLYLISRRINHPYFERSPFASKMLDRLSDLCFKLL